MPATRKPIATAVAEDMASRVFTPPKPEQRKKGRRKRDTIPVTTRLEPVKRDALEEYFRARGGDLSGGIRQVLYEFMTREHIG
jgi:hypothetical protein